MERWVLTGGTGFPLMILCKSKYWSRPNRTFRTEEPSWMRSQTSTSNYKSPVVFSWNTKTTMTWWLTISTDLNYFKYVLTFSVGIGFMPDLSHSDFQWRTYPFLRTLSHHQIIHLVQQWAFLNLKQVCGWKWAFLLLLECKTWLKLHATSENKSIIVLFL